MASHFLILMFLLASVASDSGRGRAGPDERLIEAIGKWDQTLIEAALKEGADPNQRLPGDLTPIMLAVARADLRVLHACIQAGANLDLVDMSGYTALMFAVGMRNTEIIEALLNAGADLSVINPRSGSTALDQALDATRSRSILSWPGKRDDGSVSRDWILIGPRTRRSDRIVQLLTRYRSRQVR